MIHFYFISQVSSFKETSFWIYKEMSQRICCCKRVVMGDGLSVGAQGCHVSWVLVSRMAEMFVGTNDPGAMMITASHLNSVIWSCQSVGGEAHARGNILHSKWLHIAFKRKSDMRGLYNGKQVLEGWSKSPRRDFEAKFSACWLTLQVSTTTNETKSIHDRAVCTGNSTATNTGETKSDLNPQHLCTAWSSSPEKCFKFRAATVSYGYSHSDVSQQTWKEAISCHNQGHSFPLCASDDAEGTKIVLSFSSRKTNSCCQWAT